MAPRPTDVADRDRHVGFTWRGWWDARGRLQWPWVAKSWQTWRPDPVPNLDGVLWSDAPWFEPVSGHSIDLEATAQLAAWDGPVRTSVGGVSTGNVHGGSPWQDITYVARTTQVIDLYGRSHQVPLPEVVRRFGDPTGTQNDLQWVGIDFAKRLMWECSALRPGLIGSAWWAYSVKCWDLDAAWDAEPGGITATNLPLVAGIARPEEFARGHIDHALWFVADRYSDREVRWPARATDGLYPDHPLVAGMRLCLRPDWQPTRALTADERTLVGAMRADTGRGLIVSDRTHPDHGSTIRHAMDPRVRIGDLGLRLSDFLILT